MGPFLVTVHVVIVILDCVSHSVIRAQEEFVFIHLASSNHLRIGARVKMCCRTSGRWRDLTPEFRLKVDPDDDRRMVIPNRNSSGYPFEFCYYITVAPKHHLRNATCNVTYVTPHGFAGPTRSSFSVSFVMKAFSGETGSIVPTTVFKELCQPWSCVASEITFDSPNEYNLTSTVSAQFRSGILNRSTVIQRLGYLDPQRQLLAMHRVEENIDLVVREENYHLIDTLNLSCKVDQVFVERLHSVTTKIRNMPPYAANTLNSAAAAVLAATALEQARNGGPLRHGPDPDGTPTNATNATAHDPKLSKAQEQADSQRILSPVFMGGLTVFITGLAAVCVTGVYWVRLRKRERAESSSPVPTDLASVTVSGASSTKAVANEWHQASVSHCTSEIKALEDLK